MKDVAYLVAAVHTAYPDALPTVAALLASDAQTEPQRLADLFLRDLAGSPGPLTVAQPATAAAEPAQVGLSEEQMQQLQQLAALKEQGVLTQEEFDAQKAAILAST